MSTALETATEHYRAGRLQPAIEAAGAAVRAAPRELSTRTRLAELLLFAGNLERADVILDAASQLDPTLMVVIAEFRQLLRAETARRQLYRDGRLPEFLGEPTPAQRAALAGLVALRAGDAAAAGAAAAEAEALRPRAPGRAGDVAFDDFRDVDDLCAGFFEVLTTTGKYFWIPTERVAQVIFHPPGRWRDLCWRRASMSVIDGPDGDVYIPTTYAGTEPPDDSFRLGRATDWRQAEGGPVLGIGRRLFLAGEEALDVMALETLVFAA